MRARIEQLERERENAAEREEELAAATKELAQLRARVSELEAESVDSRSLSRSVPPTLPLAVAPVRRPGLDVGPTPLRGPRALGLSALVFVLAALVALGPCGGSMCVPMTWTGGDAEPSVVLLDLDVNATPAPITSVASGWRSPPPGCAGRYPEEPQIAIRNREPTFVHFSLMAHDSLLVVLLSDGTVHCEPAMRVVLPPGEHRVWVGTVGGGPQPFTLTLETDPSS